MILGLDFTIIKGVLDVEVVLPVNTMLTYDVMYGDQLYIIKENHPNYEFKVWTNKAYEGVDEKHFLKPWVVLPFITDTKIGEYEFPKLEKVLTEKSFKFLEYNG